MVKHYVNLRPLVSFVTTLYFTLMKLPCVHHICFCDRVYSKEIDPYYATCGRLYKSRSLMKVLEYLSTWVILIHYAQLMSNSNHPHFNYGKLMFNNHLNRKTFNPTTYKYNYSHVHIHPYTRSTMVNKT